MVVPVVVPVLDVELPNVRARSPSMGANAALEAVSMAASTTILAVRIMMMICWAHTHTHTERETCAQAQSGSAQPWTRYGENRMSHTGQA